MITFWYTTGKYGPFSNFSKHSVFIDDKEWPTTEHYYQAMKSIDPEIQEQIRLCSTPKKAKQLANSVELRDNWENIKFYIMLKAIRAKVEHHSSIKKLLLETENSLIAENSPYDYIWGLGANGTGQNLLGKIWVRVRNELFLSSDDLFIESCTCSSTIQLFKNFSNNKNIKFVIDSMEDKKQAEYLSNWIYYLISMPHNILYMHPFSFSICGALFVLFVKNEGIKDIISDIINPINPDSFSIIFRFAQYLKERNNEQL